MKNLLFILFSLTAFTSCIKNPYTKKTTGKYFHCKVDGKNYYPEQDPDFNSGKPLSAKLDFNDSSLLISTYNLNDEKLSFGIWDFNGIQAKTYLLNDHKPYTSSGIYDNTPLGSGQFISDTTHTGEFAITNFDKAKNLIEGKFHFKAFNELTQKTVNVSDGEFSIFLK
jgi:hypothetical protein